MHGGQAPPVIAIQEPVGREDGVLRFGKPVAPGGGLLPGEHVRFQALLRRCELLSLKLGDNQEVLITEVIGSVRSPTVRRALCFMLIWNHLLESYSLLLKLECPPKETHVTCTLRNC